MPPSPVAGEKTRAQPGMAVPSRQQPLVEECCTGQSKPFFSPPMPALLGASSSEANDASVQHGLSSLRLASPVDRPPSSRTAGCAYGVQCSSPALGASSVAHLAWGSICFCTSERWIEGLTALRCVVRGGGLLTRASLNRRGVAGRAASHGARRGQPSEWEPDQRVAAASGLWCLDADWWLRRQEGLQRRDLRLELLDAQLSVLAHLQVDQRDLDVVARALDLVREGDLLLFGQSLSKGQTFLPTRCEARAAGGRDAQFNRRCQ
eukprot:6188846-Pleurochrysis_carterae.AAC.3